MKIKNQSFASCIIANVMIYVAIAAFLLASGIPQQVFHLARRRGIIGHQRLVGVLEWKTDYVAGIGEVKVCTGFRDSNGVLQAGDIDFDATGMKFVSYGSKNHARPISALHTNIPAELQFVGQTLTEQQPTATEYNVVGDKVYAY